MKVNLINFNIKGDFDGNLIAIENSKNIPFSIKRAFYIFNTQPNVIRGKHAHYKTNQVLICISGSCSIKLFDGMSTKVIQLTNNTTGLLLPPHYWHEMYDFSDGAILMVLADTLYDESDYIRDKDTFIKYTQTLTIT